MSRCPLCAEPADRHCRPCQVRIERNARGEVERARQRHPADRSRWVVVYQGRQNARPVDDGPRRARLHTADRERYLPGIDPADELVGLDIFRPFGRLNIRNRTKDVA